MIVKMVCNACGGIRHTDCKFGKRCDRCGEDKMVLREKSTWVGSGDDAKPIFEQYDRNGNVTFTQAGKSAKEMVAMAESPRKKKAKDKVKSYEAAPEPEVTEGWVDPMSKVKSDIEHVAA